MTVDEGDSNSVWTIEQDKAFENALATYPEDSSDRWEKITEDVPGKNLEEIKHHYELLVDDVNKIESGRVPLPSYNSSSEGSKVHAGNEGTSKKGGHAEHFNSESNHGSKASRSDQERRKGIAWTEEEHRLLYFLHIYAYIHVFLLYLWFLDWSFLIEVQVVKIKCSCHVK